MDADTIDELERAQGLALQDDLLNVPVEPDRPLDLVDLAGDVSRLRDAALCGEEPVPLSLPPAARGKVRAWRDAGYLCTSMRVRGPDGRARVVTSCSPVSDHVEEVVGLAQRAGVDELEALSYLPTLASMRGAGALVDRLDAARVAGCFSDERFLDTSRPHFGEVSPEGQVRWS